MSTLFLLSYTFHQWALGIISSGVSSTTVAGIQNTTEALKSAIQKLPQIFKEAAHSPLLPRPVLNYFAIVASGIFMLEHAVWSAAHDHKAHGVDLEAFRRWVDSELRTAEDNIANCGHEWRKRATMDSNLVFEGWKGMAKL
jgi:hypothetical protein